MGEQPPKPAKHKILLAEDNAVVRKGLEEFLKKWGYEPISFDSGDLAWEALENDQTIRLAIIDWNLPGLSGIQICQRLRTRLTAPYVYAIMFSARKSHEEKIMALEGGADDYLVKPCKPSELRARLRVGIRIINMACPSPPQPPPAQLDKQTDAPPAEQTDSPPEKDKQAPEE